MDITRPDVLIVLASADRNEGEIVGHWGGDRIGRRRCYTALYSALGVVGAVYALSTPWWALAGVALTGALSTEVVESGPFTSIEQALLGSELAGGARIHAFAVYNAVATAAGALGALAAGVPDMVASRVGEPPLERYVAVFVVVAVAECGPPPVSARTPTPSPPPTPAAAGEHRRSSGLGASKATVWRLAGLFATDAFGGGFVVQAFIAYWFGVRFGASTAQLGVMFFVVGTLQTASFLVTPLVVRRVGLLNTMVFTQRYDLVGGYTKLAGLTALADHQEEHA